MEKRIETDFRGGRDLWFPHRERTSALEKLAAELHPEVQEWLGRWTPNPDFPVLLMSPMGASEFYSSNSNGDWWPELELNPPGTRAWGHKTFEEANLFSFHANKDVAQSRGKIPLSVWNPRMHRVEVVAVYDRKRCEALGAGYICAAIDSGEFFPISMGANVVCDICSICGSRHRVTAEYCEHLRTAMSQVLPGGKLCCAINIKPRFKDISDVHVEAAKESGVICKVASAEVWSLAPAEVPAASGVRRALKLAERKQADIDKTGPPNIVGDLVDPLSRATPEVPVAVLRGIAASDDPQAVLRLLGLGGVVLPPRDYARMRMLQVSPSMEPLCGDLPWTYTPVEAPTVPDVLPAVIRQLLRLVPTHGCGPRALVLRIHTAEEPGALKQAACGLPAEVVAELSKEYARYRGEVLLGWRHGLHEKVAAMEPGFSSGGSILATGIDSRLWGLAQQASALYAAAAFRNQSMDPESFLSSLEQTFEGL